MSLSEVLTPAIQYAMTGYPVSPIIAAAFGRRNGQADPIPLRQRASARRSSTPDGGSPFAYPSWVALWRPSQRGDGTHFTWENRPAVYPRTVQERGGWLSEEDFANHASTWDEPISTTYRDVTCWECPPNGQGINALMALNIAEGFDLPGMGFQSVATYHHLIESMRLAFADGFRYVADPRRVGVPVGGMLSKERAEERRALISPDRAMAEAPYDSSLGGSDTVYVTCVDGTRQWLLPD